MVDGTAGDHQAGIQGASGDSTERVPCSVVKPIPKLVEAICDKVLGCSEVKPRIDWMDWLASCYWARQVDALQCSERERGFTDIRE